MKIYGWTALLAVALAGLARADDVLLGNGRTLVGIASEESSQWLVKTRFGDLRVPKAEVICVSRGQTPMHDFEERRATLESCPAASEIFDLALWAQEQGLIRYVHALLTQTISLEPDHAQARWMLGYSRVDDRWMTSSERKAWLASQECTPVPAPKRLTQARARRSLETTPYGLGIPMTRARSTSSYGASRNDSVGQGLLFTSVILNLAPGGRR